jgi:hypothetical protein
MLHRYVGGILKDLAAVEVCTVSQALNREFDLYVVYTVGIVFRELNKTVATDRIISVSLFPLPQGIKRVLRLPEGSHLGIIAGHIWDAADLLGQLISVGVRDFRFSTGTLETAVEMKADCYIVPEEIAPYIKDENIKKLMTVVPRSLDSKSVADIIKRAIKAQAARGAFNHSC